MGNGTFVTHYKKAFVGELEATYKNNPTTPSLNYWSSFNANLHDHTIAYCKLQIGVMQKSMSTVVIKSQLDLPFCFCNPYVQYTNMYAIEEGVTK